MTIVTYNKVLPLNSQAHFLRSLNHNSYISHMVHVFLTNVYVCCQLEHEHASDRLMLNIVPHPPKIRKNIVVCNKIVQINLYNLNIFIASQVTKKKNF